ncbi:MAG: polysaccharide biosynthesis protein [Kiritimatiellales bacterium]|nr:polysaccharide biosynthesis protein [Kiritimatiellales bacterium]
MKDRIKEFLKRHHMALSICLTTACCALSFLGAFFLRFDFGRIPAQHLMAMLFGLPVMVAIRILALGTFRVHRGLYRYASLYDFVRIFYAQTASSVLFASVWLLTAQHHYFMPRSIYIIDWMLSMASLMGLRVAVRLWRKRDHNKPRRAESARVDRALIVGAGDLGESILRMVDHRFLGHDLHVVGFVDNDPVKLNICIHGAPVLGCIPAVPELVLKHDVDVVLFAISAPEPDLFAAVVGSCEGLDIRFNTVSLLKDAFTGEVSAQQLRELDVEDLLGRIPVTLDVRPVRASMTGRTVLVSGAAGSIGSELCRQIALFAPQRMILFDNAESPLFEIDRELRQSYPTLDIQPFIGDVKQADVVDGVFAAERPDFVYHAAAYKHVPLMEAHPDEAVLNNVRGTRHLAEAARHHGCKRFVMISTDKAVRPTNVMGATKRMCERVIQSMNGGDTIFAAVRFGNVLGSNGSVIPVFKKQIAAGGPLTVTHPGMTRFFMTIPEAVSLVLQCGVIAEPGDIFVLDMGVPVKIMDLAKNMIRLSGLRENVDIAIKVTGLRPGEKMYEELVAHGELLQATSVPKVNVLKKSGNGVACDVLMAMIHRLEEISLARQVDEVRALLWRLIELDVERNGTGMDMCSEKCLHGVVWEWMNADDVSCARVPPTVPKGRVLAVVSNPAEEAGLKEAVRGAGHELDCLNSAEEALKLLVSDRAYVAILCDYIIPASTAWRFCDQVRALGCHAPLVAMSACDGQMIDHLMEFDPSMPLLRKPFRPEDFAAAFAKVVPRVKTTGHARRSRLAAGGVVAQ